MTEKPYQWSRGATLEEHSRRKLRIIRDYFGRYLAVRCALPQQSRFRLAIVDGFAGGGRYSDGSPGSPIIFLEELRTAIAAFNIKRRDEGMAALAIECLLVLNDNDPGAIQRLRANVEPVLASIRSEITGLHVLVEYRNQAFEAAYPEIKMLLEQGRYRNVLFNLDQCGHKWVSRATLIDIMRGNTSAEIFYTFMIEALLAFLRKSDPQRLASQLRYLHLDDGELRRLEGAMNNQVWLGVAENLVFDAFQNCAPFVSPFSINNPDGWRYWLIHFANSSRARQVYNDVLHVNSSMQAHFGRSGLHMLAHDPHRESGSLYLFDEPGREASRNELVNDIPRLVSDFGDAVGVSTFYEAVYNITPAHSDDIHAAMIEASDLEIITLAGGARRSPNAIRADDTLRMKQQRTFFPMFLRMDKPPS